MKIALVADAFPPLRNSGAVQLHDLSREFARQGHQVTVMLPSADLDGPWRLEYLDNVQVLRLRAPATKDTGYLRRTLGEASMPYAMRQNLRKSPLANQVWDGVVWYSPSIFHGPFVRSLKMTSHCRAYLIIRDIFPEWAVDMGLMGRGLPYLFFRMVARYQFSVADIIGVQTSGNLTYFESWRKQSNHVLEVLQNWLGEPAYVRCSIRLDDTSLAGRKIFVYAGNMGVAQGMDIFLDLAEKYKHRENVGFLFVGRGSEVNRLRVAAHAGELVNTLFFDEIHPDEIPDLCAQCHVGIVALDPRHKSHNIPGKFLTYMRSGLPALANINAGNDLADLILSEKVGKVCETNQLEELQRLAEELLLQVDADTDLPRRCFQLFKRRFSVDQAVRQIAAALSS